MKKQETMPFVSCIVAAGGSGKRMGQNKLFMELDGIPVICHTLLNLSKSPVISEIVIAAKEEDILYLSDLVKTFELFKVKSIVKGGKERSQSVKAAISAISAQCEFVAVHDGARPLIDETTISEVVNGAIQYGAAACGVRPKCTLKKEDENGFISETVDRSVMFEIQTPQVFAKELFLNAYEAEEEILQRSTDDCSLIERLGTKIKITQGSYQNIKITTPEDIKIAEAFLSEE